MVFNSYTAAFYNNGKCAGYLEAKFDGVICTIDSFMVAGVEVRKNWRVGTIIKVSSLSITLAITKYV